MFVWILCSVWLMVAVPWRTTLSDSIIRVPGRQNYIFFCFENRCLVCCGIIDRTKGTICVVLFSPNRAPTHPSWIYSISHGVCRFVVLCFVVIRVQFLVDSSELYFHILQGCFGSLALGQSYDCHSASEATLKDMSKIDHWIPQICSFYQDYFFNVMTVFPGGRLQLFQYYLQMAYCYNGNTCIINMACWYWNGPCSQYF